MYGGSESSDENAMKSAAAEMKGLLSYHSCNIPELNFPLMAVIDYKVRVSTHPDAPNPPYTRRAIVL